MAYGVNAPFGLAPVRTLSGANWNEQINNYVISYNTTTNVTAAALYVGDPVEMLATGMIQEFDLSNNPCLGVFVGAVYTDINGVVQYTSSMPNATSIKAGTLPIAKVVDDPWVIFQIQANNSTALTTPQSFIGSNAEFDALDPNTLLGQSGFVLDSSTTATTAAFPMRILRFAETVDKDLTASYVVFEVLINNHFYKQLTGI